MPNAPCTFFDHSRHKLQVRGLEATLDVLAFHGKEHLSQPFHYHIEFTSRELDLGAQQLLGQDARFSLYAPPVKPLPGLSLPEVKPLRTVFGVVSAFKRLSASVDEARYEITLQPRLALLDRGRQYRIYQQQSVPEIVESILRNRHGFRGQDFLLRLVREYPRREQVMQYNESDLMFISRLLADVGIWYRFTSDERLRIDVVEFCDDQRGYEFDVRLPYRPPAGLSSAEDGVWALQTCHQVVERHVNVRAYQHRDARAYLDGDVDQTRGATTTYGEAYQGLSLFVRKLGIKLIANQGAVQIQAQNDKLELMARHGLDITSTEDEIRITAKNKITLNGGGSYITLDECRIESGTAGDHKVKAAHFAYSGAAKQALQTPALPQLTEHDAKSMDLTDFSA